MSKPSRFIGTPPAAESGTRLTRRHAHGGKEAVEEAAHRSRAQSSAYALQGRDEESEALLHQIHAKPPDYLFARVALAQQRARRDEIDAARALLEPLLSRKRFHASEFVALCQTEMEFALVQNMPEAARSWLAMLAEHDSDHPAVDAWRIRLAIMEDE